MFKLTKKKFLKATLATFLISAAILSFVYFPKADTLGNGSMGIVSFIASLPSNQDKRAMISKIKKAGFDWVREEYTYTLPMNYVPFDNAYEKITNADLKILGLLTYPGPDKPHDVWQKYVTDTVVRYPEVQAWEIMNEADNYLSASEYTVYLKEASQIIRAKSKAKIVASGVTARVGANQFWDGINQAGGWNYFDEVGLHIYHQGDPFKKQNDYGTFADELKKVGEDIQKNGGGKKIWITEFGFDTNDYGEENQAKWLVDSLKIMKAMPIVEQVFVFRLYEHDNGLGLLTSNFSEKPSFPKIAQWIADGLPATKVALFPDEQLVQEAPSDAKVDLKNSIVRVSGENVSSDGQEQFMVAVQLKDNGGKPIVNQKPDYVVTGPSTSMTEFTLKGDQWVSYVASTESGEKLVDVKVGNIPVGQAKMVFGATDIPKPAPIPVVISETSATVTPAAVTVREMNNIPSAGPKKSLARLIIAESIILLLIFIVLKMIWQRSSPSY